MRTEKQLQVMLHVFPQTPAKTEEWDRGSLGEKRQAEVCPRSAEDEAMAPRRKCVRRAALGLKKIARADHHDILEKRRLGNADVDSS